MSNETQNSVIRKTAWVRKIAFGALVILAVGIAMFYTVRNDSPGKERQLETQVERPRAVLGSKEIDLEIVNTPEAQAKGLGGRDSLDRNRGMLFAFKVPGKYCFWMKDMKFSIDILWIRNDGSVSQLAENVQPKDVPEPICPQEDGKYVLEVNSGVAKENNVQVGSTIQIIK